MAVNSVIRARINKQVKQEATSVLETMGLTASDAFRMMMIRIAAEKRLPFEPRIYNTTTIDAMAEARAGRLKSYRDVRKLLTKLDAED
jgi:DNA-damage-inducible protein J